ncbi:MAG TPA: MBL fold metallo-hydrolase [Magnetospirillaceae bacterium]|nr:MBL fold metallo-hydrolase [Magnetospirillaceae bacterium]
MQITKFVHSCLLVETPERVALFDPGQFSWESGLFDPNKLERLDDIFITHEHFDHCWLPFIQALIARFPQVRITGPQAVVTQLAESNITATVIASKGVMLIATNHESVAPLGVAPEHIGFHYLDKLTHAGDSHHLTETQEVLALAATAPWGTLMRCAELGAELKPKTIIPIHDWHWNDTARVQAYDRLEAFFKQHDITFIKPIDGEKFSA